MIRFLILAGYFELSLYLYLTGKLDHYINSHYTYLAFLSMILSLILALVQLTIWVKQIKTHSHLKGRFARLTSPLILVFPVLVGLLVPTVTLDSTTVAAKGYHFPLAAGSSSSFDGTEIQYLKPDTSLYFTRSSYEAQMTKALAQYQGTDPVTISQDNYMEVMELIYLFPQAFVGRDISYTGFVYKDPLHQDYQFLFRFGIIHCIADSGVYGLLTTGNEEVYSDNDWVTVTGQISIEYNQELNQSLPVLHISQSQLVQTPDNPYVYRTF